MSRPEWQQQQQAEDSGWQEWYETKQLAELHELTYNLQGLEMKTSELKQSKYLKKEDCGDGGILVTITGLKQDNVALEGKPDDIKWIMTFGECKPMVLNGTNSQLIEKALGSDETDDWTGKKIVLFHDENVSFGGELVGGIRCDVARTKRYHAKGAPAKPAGVGQYNTGYAAGGGAGGGGGKPAHFDDFESDVPF